MTIGIVTQVKDNLGRRITKMDLYDTHYDWRIGKERWARLPSKRFYKGIEMKDKIISEEIAAGKKVLLIDDEVNTLITFSYCLEKEGYQVDVSRNGEDGLRKFRRYSYDVVLLDVRLPDMDGWEVLNEIKGVRKSTPVIMITAFESSHMRKKENVFEYLLKPLSPGEIRRTVGKAVLNNCHSAA